MYTGNYYQKEQGISIPHDYSGNTFTEEVPACECEEAKEATAPLGSNGILGSIASAFPLGRIFPEGMRGALHLEKFKLGTEELLLIALALFLFLSKDGDKECAIILFLLLFVN
jgi:hypothetical protein